ncbi:hypothetical protein B0O99DRAFT_647092 [Bisporella sp. PMI_857]|nr:hypothetical protein B0O99DRAFT_647092 [Bisporella sp. PMI_857]
MAYQIRAHQKSRSGCNFCKFRRVKCNEAKPKCASCLRRGTECVYLPTTKRKARSTMSNASCEDNKALLLPFAQHTSEGSYNGAKNLLDLRLMHQYCVFTTQYFASAFPEKVSTTLRVDIPKLAFQHQFLMDTILLVAIVHLVCSDPAALVALPVCLYRDRALSGLRGAVAEASPQNRDAIRGASVLLATVSFAADRVSGESGLWVANWLTLAFGQRNFRSPKATSVATPVPSSETVPPRPSLYGSFDDVMAPAAIPTIVLRALEEEQERIDDADRDVLCHVAGELGRLIGALKRPYEQSWLEKKIKAWAFDVVPPEFLMMAREGKFHAVVILAHYLILFKLLPDLWVYEGLANHDITVICQTLDQEQQDYIAAPRRALQIDEDSAIVALLVKCLGEER